MTRYRIATLAGVHQANVEAESPEEAIEVVYKYLGYTSTQDAAERLGLTVEGLCKGLMVTVVEETFCPACDGTGWRGEHGSREGQRLACDGTGGHA